MVNPPTQRRFPVVFKLLVCALIAASAAGCSQAGPKTSQISTRGPDAPAVLRICTTGDYKPLTYRDPATGDYSGIDIEMAKDLATHLGRTPVFVPTSWASLMADITVAGMCDVAVGGISPTPAREAIADFTRPYLANGKTPLTTTANGGRLQTIDQINQHGVRVIAPAGGTNEQFAKQNFPKANLIISKDNTAIFSELIGGKADVMVTDVIEAIYQARQHPELVAVHPDKPFTNDHKAYMLPKGSPLSQPTKEWLTEALNNGTFDRIYNQWMK
jgi:cyclohexadienyl dehydratase